MHEMIETLAVLGQREREEMLRWYEDRMPEDTSRRNMRLECWGPDGCLKGG